MVIWTARARADLKSIHEYIAKDAPLNARSVVQDIKQKADTLTDFPLIGKKISEIDHDDLRETAIHSWRIIYHLRHNRIFVITIVHKRQILDASDLHETL